MKLFVPFDLALEKFYAADGARVAAIRPPRKTFEAFIRASSHASLEALRCMDEHVELAQGQNYVSVRGTPITARSVQIPITA
jgi:hypothetical protein